MKGYFATVEIDLKMSWLEHFPKLNKQRVWNKNDLGGGFSKN